MKKIYHKITQKQLDTTVCTLYGGGRKLQVNDKVYSGFTINYANLYGISPSNYNPNDISLSLKLFVEKDGILYELYK